MIAIIDYKAGNLTSVVAAVNKLNHRCIVTSDPKQIAQAKRVIFPGVGAAGAAMKNLQQLNIVECLQNIATSGKPFLGICLGYQILFSYSQEDNTKCLDIIPGQVVHFANNMQENNQTLKIPQMGWNTVNYHAKQPLWNNIPKNSEFYFVHSYYPETDKQYACATCNYGIEFTCGIIHNNIVGFQFHPEKSGRPGLQLLDNFCKWNP